MDVKSGSPVKVDGLVSPQEPRAPLRWMVAFVVGCALLTAVYKITEEFWLSLSRPPINALDEQRQNIAAFRLGSTPDVAIVGTSLSQHLQPAYFNTHRVSNLALPGGSSATGLEIISNREQLPGIVLVEANLLYRDVDKAMVEAWPDRAKWQDRIVYLFSDLKPIRSLLAMVLDVPPIADVIIGNPDLKATRKDNHGRRAEVLLNSPKKSSADTARQLQRVAEDEAIDLSNAPTVLEKVGKHVDSIVSRGSQVVLFELPVPPLVNESGYMARMRELVEHHVIGDRQVEMVVLGVGNQELSWPDAHHLDERSSVFICREITEILVRLQKVSQ